MKISVRILAACSATLMLLCPAAGCFADEGNKPHVDAVIAKARQEAEQRQKDAEEAKANEGKLSLKAITSLIQEEQNRTRGVISARMFENPDRDYVLQAFRQYLLQQPINIKGGAELAPGEEANRDEIVQLYKIMKCMQEEFRPAFRRVLRMAIVGEFAKRLRKLELTHQYVNEYFTEKFKAFDDAFYNFKKDVDTMQANGVYDVSGPEILMASGLDKFATDSMRLQPRFDKTLRALDNHLRAISTEVLNQLYTDAETLYKQHEESIKAYERVRDAIAVYKYADRVAGIMSNYAELISQVELLCLRIKTLIQDAEKEDTIIGKVRMMSKSLTPHGAFQVDDGAVRQGTPVYTRRALHAIRECRSYYLEAAKKLNAANQGLPGYKPIPTVWK